MKKLSTRKLKLIHNTIAEYDQKNRDIIFDIPSMMKYCIENDIRKLLEEKKLREDDINNILESIDFDVHFKQMKPNVNSVKIMLNYTDYTSFENCYLKICS